MKGNAALADDIDEGQEAPEPTLRETIEAARDSVIDEQIKDRVEDGEPAPTGPLRDDLGRFTRRAAAPPEGEPGAQGTRQAAAPPPADAPAPDAPPAQGAAPAGTPAPDAGLAPQGWSPSAKAKWANLDPEIKAEVSRREQETHRALSRQDEERGWGKNFAEISQRHAAAIQRAGVHPLRIYEDFLNIMTTLATGSQEHKAELIRDVALRNGLDPRALLGGAAPNPNPSPAPGPGQIPLPPAVASTVNEWQEFKAAQAREAQEKEQREQQNTFNEIVAFRSKPEARFFDAVKDQMVALLQANAVSTLEEAYAQAIWTRPDIRAILQKEEADKQAAAARRQAIARNARLKAGSVRGGAAVTVPDGGAPDRSLREELQANFAEARARV